MDEGGYAGRVAKKKASQQALREERSRHSCSG